VSQEGPGSFASKKYKVSVRKNKKGTMKGIRAEVKRALMQTVEKKELNFYASAQSLAGYSNAGQFSSQIVPISPYGVGMDIDQGTGQGNRVGNRIKTKSSYITGILYAQQQNATYNPNPKPCEVLIMVYKIIGGGNNVETNLSNLFQNGSTSGNPTGSLADLTFPINKDKYRVMYRKVFKIGAADNTGTGSSIGQQYFANNDYKRNQRFYIPLTKYMDKNVRYQDTSLTCQNDTLYLLILPLMADGTTNVGGNALLPINCIMTQVYNFTDV